VRLSGETSLQKLLQFMDPVVHEPVYVFATVPFDQDISLLEPIMTFREAEGITLILERSAAENHGLQGIFPSRMITLNINSALDAVGFLAAVTTELAALKIGVNPVSAFYHDHLFVPAEYSERAHQALITLSNRA
jgi:hypothetical protein